MSNEFAMNLKTFISICKDRNITPVLMTQSSRLKNNPDNIVKELMGKIEIDYGINYQEYQEIFNLFNQIIREIGVKNNILVIDLAQKIPQEKEYMYDIMHLNNNGSKYTAEIISEKLKNYLITLPLIK